VFRSSRACTVSSNSHADLVLRLGAASAALIHVDSPPGKRKVRSLGPGIKGLPCERGSVFSSTLIEQSACAGFDSLVVRAQLAESLDL
jgi:hypothetical protein